MVLGENTMVVPISAEQVADEAKVLCIIRDMTDTACSNKINLNLPGSQTATQLIEEVGRQCKYVPGTFSLVYECTNEEGLSTEIPIEELASQKIGDICANCGNGKRNNFTLGEKNGQAPQKAEMPGDSPSGLQLDNMSLGASASPTTENKDIFSANYSSSTTPSYSYSYASALMKSDTGFVGLVNQAMTCYLNSLLQTLFMTPEFRNALYRWEFDGTDDEAPKSIPFQLQRLFINLQTTTKRACETTDITKSFGWDSSEAWQQHDVQELCRVMFDALEKKMRNTDQADLINQLYQGKLKDYVKCLECSYESARTDAYLDIPLVIRPFGATQAYKSVEQALEAFVQPELLDQSNQYFCEKCNKKCNAHKGLKFISFPYLLTLQLKRFDFDYSTMHRIKLNDRVTFPMILDLNHLVGEGDLSGEGQDGGGVEEAAAKDSSSPVSPDDGELGVDEGIDIGYSGSGTSTNSEATSVNSDSSLNSEAANNERNMEETKYKGPFVYELFSIMVHSGSAAGGHYYAYIKSFSDGQWYSFNDQHVSPITTDDIRKTYGGSSSNRGYYSATFASSTNAYMLMYRRIDKEKNADFIPSGSFPEHIKGELNSILEKEEHLRQLQEIEKSMCKIKLFCRHPLHVKQVETKLEVHKNKSLKEATEMAWRLLELEKHAKLCNVRLVKYDELHDSLERSYEGMEDEQINVVLGGVKSIYTFDLLMEIKKEEQEFQEYKPGGVTVKVFLVDLVTEIINEPISIRACSSQTVREFKSLVAQTLKLPVDCMRCVLERYYNDLRLLTRDDRPLKTEGFYRSNKVFIECSGTEIDTQESPFINTRFQKILERYENTIRIYISLPKLQAAVIDLSPSPEESQDGNEQHTVTTKPTVQDVDEGICDNEDNKDKSNRDDSYSDITGSGPLRAPHGSSTDIHSMISETIHRQNLTETQRSLSDSTLAVTCNSTAECLPAAANGDSVNDRGTPDGAAACSSTPVKAADDNSYKEFISKSEECWDYTGGGDAAEEDREQPEEKFYFKAMEGIEPVTGSRLLTAYVDKRITLHAVKRELEPFMGVTSEYFKVYKVYSNNQEFESTRLNETLSSYVDDSKLTIKYGRALKKGEYRVKIFQLLVGDPEPSKFLFETIFAKGMTVLQSKKIVSADLQAQCDIDVPVERCRLRKKAWKNPGTIYVDTQVYDQDLAIYANFEMFVEILEEADHMTSMSQLAVYCRRWSPSKYEVGPFQEVILGKSTVEELKTQISVVAELPLEHVEFAKGQGSFPCEMSVLDIQDLDWNPNVTVLNMWPLYICDDGNVVYYRDKNEELQELDEEQKKDLQQKENARLAKTSCRITGSPRKERALKIYTDDTPTKDAGTEVTGSVSPELD